MTCLARRGHKNGEIGGLPCSTCRLVGEYSQATADWLMRKGKGPFDEPLLCRITRSAVRLLTLLQNICGQVIISIQM